MRGIAPIAVTVVALAVAPAVAKLRVVATTPEYGALASAVGGHLVEVATLAKATEDPHFVDAKPSHIVTLHRADVLIEGGADLEVGWLLPLVEGARNAKVNPGARGRLRASEGVVLLDVPTVLDRSRGDIHAVGNPHFMMDPSNARIVAAHIGRTFCSLDGANCAIYEKNLAAFDSRLAARSREWDAALEPFRGKPIVTYHPTWRYFAARYGLVSDVFLEPKPGIPPSPPHLATVIRTMQERKIGVVLVEPFQSEKTAHVVADRVGATIVHVCQFPGGLPGTDGDYVALMDANVKAIAAALATAP